MLIIGQGLPKLVQVVWQADPHAYSSFLRVHGNLYATVSRSAPISFNVAMHCVNKKKYKMLIVL